MATTNTKVVAKNELDKFAMEEKGVSRMLSVRMEPAGEAAVQD